MSNFNILSLFCIFTWLYLINVLNMCCRGLNDPFPAPCCLYSLSSSTVSGLTYLSSRRYSEAKFCIPNTFFLFPHREQWGKLGYPPRYQGKIWRWIIVSDEYCGHLEAIFYSNFILCCIPTYQNDIIKDHQWFYTFYPIYSISRIIHITANHFAN